MKNTGFFEPILILNRVALEDFSDSRWRSKIVVTLKKFSGQAWSKVRMPIYEFTCRNCHSDIEVLVRGEEKPVCSQCQSSELERRLSVIATPSNGPGVGDSVAEACTMPRCCGGGCNGNSIR